MTFSFIFKTCSDQILAKLISRGGGGGWCCSFLMETSVKLLKVKKIFLCLKIAEIDMGVNFGSKSTILDIKLIFFTLNPFPGVNIRIR